MSAKVLVVEDNPDTSQVVALLLGLEGIWVATALDGLEGMSKAASVHPHLIVTDLMMPNLGGLAMIRLLREQPDLKDVPIIAFTAYGELATEAIQAGANGVVEKTAGFEVLLGTVKNLLSPPEETTP